MKIGLDIRPFLSEETGVGVYFRNLLHAMADLNSDDNFFLFSSSLKKRFPEETIPNFRNRKFRDLRIPVSILNFFWFRLKFPPMGFFFGAKLDLTHSPYPLITPGGRKKIITIYDLSFIDTPALAMREASKYFTPLIERSVSKADGILTISEFTRSRIGEIFGREAEEKTNVTYLASDLEYIKEKIPEFEIPEKFFLFTGTIEPRKNLDTMIRGYALAKDSIEGSKLILAGHAGEHSEKIRKLISDLDLKKDIIITGYLKREELKYLYKNAISLVFPSHYEGFGLPILEAASSGIPSIVSDIEVFNEIFKDYPVYFDRSDPENLSEALTTIYSDENLKNDKKKKAKETEKKFSWAKTAEETLKFYKNI